MRSPGIGLANIRRAMRNFTPASILVVAVWRIARITGAIFAANETFAERGLGRDQTKQGNEFQARTRRHKNWRGKIRFWETFAPWPLCVSL